MQVSLANRSVHLLVRTLLSPFFSSIAALFFLPFFSITLFANPVPGDEQSLASGAQSYELYCAQCHGWGPVSESEELYTEENEQPAYDFTDLVDQAHASKEEKAKKNRPRDWPDWAELPDPGSKADDADVRAEIMAEMAAAIDEAYAISEPDEEPDLDDLALDAADPPLDVDDFEPELTLELSDRTNGAPDLAAPESFFYGVSEDSLFDSIANGTSAGMEGWREELGSDEAVWDLVNFIRSMWGEEWLY